MKPGTGSKYVWTQVQQQDAWGSPTDQMAQARVYRVKPWKEPKHDAQGLRYCAMAEQVFEALANEDPSREGPATSTISTLSVDLEFVGDCLPTNCADSIINWQEIKATEEFLGQCLERLTPFTARYRAYKFSRQMMDRLFGPLHDGSLGNFLHNIGQTIINCWVALIDKCSLFEAKKNKLRVMLGHGLDSRYRYSRPLVLKILAARPDLTLQGVDTFLDPLLLQDYALGLAIVVHELGRTFNLAHLENLALEERHAFNQLKLFIDEYHHDLESRYPANLIFDGIFRRPTAHPLPDRSDNSPHAYPPHPHFSKMTKEFGGLDILAMTPRLQFDFAFTEHHVWTYAPQYYHLLGSVDRQFSEMSACQVNPSDLNKIYHRFKDNLRAYLCIDTSECLLVKANQVRKQGWAVPWEVFRLLELIIRYREAATFQLNPDHGDLDDHHYKWTIKIFAIREHLREAAAKARQANGQYIQSREPLHGQFTDSMSKIWRDNKHSIKPLVAHIKEMQADIAR